MNNSENTAQNFESFTPRERILAAALKLFVEHGYFNTNVPDLSRESKCSVGSIYHSFKNKEEVARSLYEEGIGAFRCALEDSIKDVDDVEQIVKTLIKSLMTFSEVNSQLSKYIWLCRHNEFMTGIIQHPTRVGYDSLGKKLARAIKTGMREDRIKRLDAHVIWTIIFGLPLSYIRDWLDGYNALSPKDVAEDIAESCWRAMAK